MFSSCTYLQAILSGFTNRRERKKFELNVKEGRFLNSYGIQSDLLIPLPKHINYKVSSYTIHLSTHMSNAYVTASVIFWLAKKLNRIICIHICILPVRIV